MSILYHCPHLDDPSHAPFPSSYPSSSSSFSPLPSLYFCEECDAVRCYQCVAVEVASYYCPNCLFDVPSANVRADRNRCNRSCFSCPQCSTALKVQATDSPDPETGQLVAGPPYSLACTGCKWNSKTVGWEFEKPTGIALQLAKMNTSDNGSRAEFDSIKDHLESYVSLFQPPPTRPASRVPSRHISHLTQMASKALHRDIPSMAAAKSREKGRTSGVEGMDKVHVGWDELKDYAAKEAWRGDNLERDLSQMESLDCAGLERRWRQSWARDGSVSSVLPERMKLLTKLTKRCPHAGCRHLLIQPDTKSVRFKIKMVALNYLPTVEIGRRRRRTRRSEVPTTPEELEARRRERRRTRARAGDEEDQEMERPLRAGEVYTYQLAFTNPLYDPIQIRLTQPHAPTDAPPINHHVHIPTQHFTVSALKDAWAYDEDEEEDDPPLEGISQVPSDEGTSTIGTLGRRNRISLLGTTSGSTREKRARTEPGVEKKGNMTKVLLEVEVLPKATGPVTFDLEVRYTYRAEGGEEKAKEGEKAVPKDELKTFTFWVRVHVGDVQ